MVIDSRERPSDFHYPDLKKGPYEFSLLSCANRPNSSLLDNSGFYIRKIAAPNTKKYYRRFGKLISHRRNYLRYEDASRLAFTIPPESVSIANASQFSKEADQIQCSVKLEDFLAIQSVLGSVGMKTLQEVLDIIWLTSKKLNWPLEKIQIDKVKDPEVLDWQYIRLLLFFVSDFESADNFLHKLYPILDELSTKLDVEQAEILQKLIFFDVQTTLQ
jgi:hypothetical protein